MMSIVETIVDNIDIIQIQIEGDIQMIDTLKEGIRIKNK